MLNQQRLGDSRDGYSFFKQRLAWVEGSGRVAALFILTGFLAAGAALISWQLE